MMIEQAQRWVWEDVEGLLDVGITEDQEFYVLALVRDMLSFGQRNYDRTLLDDWTMEVW